MILFIHWTVAEALTFAALFYGLARYIDTAAAIVDERLLQLYERHFRR